MSDLNNGLTEESILHKKAIVYDAFGQGLKAAGVAAAVSTVGVLAAHTYSPWFRSRLGPSGKTALVVMSSLATFTFVSEEVVRMGAKRLEQQPNNSIILSQKTPLKWYHNVANYSFDHPFRLIAMIGVPMVGGIFAFQSRNSNIKLSQQIMHTRLYGQASVITLLLSSMAFHDWMAKHGKFE